ncbi:MAG: ChbG/HpnK family deacetylase [Phycisphaerae bacterium]|nr:ChbG/HpnK family deacetylase [Phycisphaerae bacterium]
MRVITNADDFGMSDELVEATIECFENGSLTSATIMPRMPGTEKAAAYARSRPDLSFGVHLTFVCDTVEAPVSDPRGLPTLVGADGRFLASNRVRVMGLRNQIPVDEIATEVEAQVRSLQERGVAISHVDSHGHLHKFRPFRRALARVLPGLGVRRVRSAQDIYLKKPLKSFNYWYGKVWRRKIRAAFVTTDHFYMPSSAWDVDWGPRLLEVMRGLRGSTIEVGVHPGYSEAWRDNERTSLLAFTEAARRDGHSIEGWNAV